ncbi:hypothetical protein GUJ93_ZPchr0007g3091 [Zizania palustris]|uniref:Uncharacterized protein n=1 Tax=Zizania palustris TaxID=103762 RepID=A0A8J5SM43_ZIZPA|nr:hypothetical protein GUJ93_ZPchr0007g3091 [Zizania palustris]
MASKLAQVTSYTSSTKPKSSTDASTPTWYRSQATCLHHSILHSCRGACSVVHHRNRRLGVRLAGQHPRVAYRRHYRADTCAAQSPKGMSKCCLDSTRAKWGLLWHGSHTFGGVGEHDLRGYRGWAAARANLSDGDALASEGGVKAGDAIGGGRRRGGDGWGRGIRGQRGCGSGICGETTAGLGTESGRGKRARRR